MAKSPIDSYEQFYPTDRAAWRQWLADNHEIAPGVWVIRYKRAAKEPTLSYEEIAEEALCFGWIDSTQRKLDDERSLLMVVPRKAKSGWSKVNKERIERLTAQGLMMPAGQAKIDAAQANGSWTLLDAAEAMILPDDLGAALAANAEAQRNFDAFPPSSKKIIFQWIGSAKTEGTRTKRVEETVRLAAQNIRANQYRPQS
jgi:uncharacterized protein YdeI (YjbR/CyaY-like superfamily)